MTIKQVKSFIFSKDAMYVSFFVNINYFQSLPLDILEEYFIYDKTKLIFDKVIEEFNAKKSKLNVIYKIINPQDSSYQEKLILIIDSFSRDTNDRFLKDWIDVFHPNYSLMNSFSIVANENYCCN